MDLNAFLQWLVASGGSVMAASWILEQIPAWQEWTEKAKKYSFFGLAALIGCGGLAVVNFASVEVIAVLSPYFAAIAAAFTAVFFGEAFHKVSKK